jgi:uncharacterized C2H2 Zn-finger protein
MCGSACMCVCVCVCVRARVRACLHVCIYYLPETNLTKSGFISSPSASLSLEEGDYNVCWSTGRALTPEVVEQWKLKLYIRHEETKDKNVVYVWYWHSSLIMRSYTVFALTINIILKQECLYSNVALVQYTLSLLYWLFWFSTFTEFAAYEHQTVPGTDWMQTCQQKSKFLAEMHVCPNCGKMYTWKTSLQRHMRKTCGKEPDLPCPYCPYITNLKSSVQKHIFKQHKDKLNVQ